MSLLRQRATERSVASTLSALSPALARLRLVRVTRSDSDPELKLLMSHARVAAGAARVATEVTAKSRAIPRARRRSRRGGAAWGSVERDMRSAYSAWIRSGSGRCGHPRFGAAECP